MSPEYASALLKGLQLNIMASLEESKIIWNDEESPEV